MDLGVLKEISSHLLPAHGEADDSVDLLDCKFLDDGILSATEPWLIFS